MRVVFVLLFLMLPAPAGAQDDTRWEAGAVFSGTFLKDIGSSDSGPGTSALGIGGRLSYGLTRFMDLETELNVWPNNPATSGRWIQALFGLKTGVRFGRAGVFAKVRPGFMHFRKDPFGASQPGAGLFGREWASTTDPGIDIGGVVQYRTSRGLILRFDLGDTIISYGRRRVFQSQFLPEFDAGGFTSHNWQGSFGLGFRF